MTARIEANGCIIEMGVYARMFEAAAGEIVSGVADVAVEQIQHSDRFKSRSGELQRRTYSQQKGAGFEVVADTPYSRWVDQGRGPVVAGSRRIAVGPGKATRKIKTGMRMLRFVINGQVFFRKSVKASRPRLFMDEASYAGAFAVGDVSDRVLENFFGAHQR
jgi:hypothetical protein